MYIVRDKKTKRIIHVNPAPLSQGLEGKDVYFQFDPQTMEMGRGDLFSVPEHFNIDERGFIVPLTLQEKVEAGLLKLPPNQKARGNDLVEKTLPELVTEGLITLKPEEKIVDNRIVPKPLSERVAEGIVKLSPTQILDSDQIREMTDGEKVAAGLIKLERTQKVVAGEIVTKSRAELARDKLITLDPDEKLEGDEVIKLNPRQMFKEGRHTLEQYKAVAIERHEQACLEARRKVLPDHELLYAAIGALSPERVTEYRTTVATYLRALDQARAAIQKARTADEVDEVPANYEQPTGKGPVIKGPIPKGPPVAERTLATGARLTSEQPTREPTPEPGGAGGSKSKKKKT